MGPMSPCPPLSLELDLLEPDLEGVPVPAALAMAREPGLVRGIIGAIRHRAVRLRATVPTAKSITITTIRLINDRPVRSRSARRRFT